MSKKTYNLDNPNYNFKKVDFNVDGALGDHIKEPFPNKSFFWLIVGKSGSGKTSLLINTLNSTGPNRVYRKVFDKITLVMPKGSRNSIVDNPFEDFPEDQLFEEMGQNVIEKVKSIREGFDEEDKKKKKRPRRQLLILDDVTAYLKDDPKPLIELATNRRHMKLSIILLVQFLHSTPFCVRSQITTVSFFKPSNNIELEIFQEEYVNLTKKEFRILSQFVFENEHDFLMIDKNSDNYYKNLRKINL